MPSRAASLSVLGGPRSGKSSFLGALWNAMEVDHTRLARVPRSRPDDTLALDRLASEIANGNYPQRTNPDERHHLTFALELTHPQDDHGRHVSVLVSDYNGEEVESLFRYRTGGWSEEWKQRAMASGILLFVRPSAVERLPEPEAPPPTEEDRWRALIDPHATKTEAPPTTSVPALPDAPSQMFGAAPVSDEDERENTARADSPVREPTELALIELLQFIREVRGLAPGERPRPEEAFRIAVMLSAWDTMERDWGSAGPKRYVLKHLPLLHDFLWSNFRSDRDIHYFGVSATNGDLRNPQFKSEYRRQRGLPGRVVWGDNFGRLRDSQDLSVPLLWTLFGDRVFDHVRDDPR